MSKNKKKVLIKNNRGLKNENPRKLSLEGVSKWLALYAAILTTMLTTYTWSEKFLPKIHSLEIYVADLRTDEKNIEFTIAYYNTGDYPEILSSVQLFLAQKITNSKKLMYWDQAECNEPMLIEPGKTLYKNYVSTVDFNKKDLRVFSTQEQSFELTLHFDFLSKERGKASERFSVATLSPYIDTSFDGKSSVDFITTKHQVDFGNARPVIIKSSYPRDKEFVSQSFCSEQI